jgi:hypothetical protein
MLVTHANKKSLIRCSVERSSAHSSDRNMKPCFSCLLMSDDQASATSSEPPNIHADATCRNYLFMRSVTTPIGTVVDIIPAALKNMYVVNNVFSGTSTTARLSDWFSDSPPIYIIRYLVDNKHMKIYIFWDITPYSQLKVCRRFGGICLLHLQGRRINGT